MIVLICLGRIICIAVGATDTGDQYFQIGDDNDAICTILIQRHRRQAGLYLMGMHGQRAEQT